MVMGPVGLAACLAELRQKADSDSLGIGKEGGSLSAGEEKKARKPEGGKRRGLVPHRNRAVSLCCGVWES